MDHQEPDKGIFGESNIIEINNETYQLQHAEFEDETFFFVKRSGQIVCMIMQNEKDEWEPDCDIDPKLFEQIIKYIHKLYAE
jgi:hypothetical protein